MNNFTSAKSLSLILLSFSLLSCRPGFDLALLKAPPKQAEQLPRLELAIDPTTFDNFYPQNYVEYEQIMEDGSVRYENRSKANVLYQDVLTVAERTLNHSICDTQGPYYGIARLKVSSCTVSNRGGGFLALSLFTVGLLNVAGMPHSRLEAIMEFELELLDAKGKVIRSYIGQGREDRVIGFYYGIGVSRRSVHAKALRMALDEIQTQISADAKMLKEAFSKAGSMR